MVALPRLFAWIVLAVLWPDSDSNARSVSCELRARGDAPNEEVSVLSEWGRVVVTITALGPHWRSGLVGDLWVGIAGPDTFSFGSGLATSTHWIVGGDVLEGGLAISLPYWFLYCMTVF